MVVVSSCNSLCPIHWRQVLSQEWRYSWSTGDASIASEWSKILLSTMVPLILEIWRYMWSVFLKASILFYTPVWKMDVLCRCHVPSSVRGFFGRFSDMLEISIWLLVYTFSTWHDMSRLSFIMIILFWLSLQPKVGQTYFLQSWPH